MAERILTQGYSSAWLTLSYDYVPIEKKGRYGSSNYNGLVFNNTKDLQYVQLKAFFQKILPEKVKKKKQTNPIKN